MKRAHAIHGSPNYDEWMGIAAKRAFAQPLYEDQASMKFYFAATVAGCVASAGKLDSSACSVVMVE